MHRIDKLTAHDKASVLRTPVLLFFRPCFRTCWSLVGLIGPGRRCNRCFWTSTVQAAIKTGRATEDEPTRRPRRMSDLLEPQHLPTDRKHQVRKEQPTTDTAPSKSSGTLSVQTPGSQRKLPPARTSQPESTKDNQPRHSQQAAVRGTQQAHGASEADTAHWHQVSPSTPQPRLQMQETATGMQVMQIKAPPHTEEQTRREKRLASCKETAYRIIGRRSHSCKELYNKLTQREWYDVDVIDETVARLQELGMLDDLEFARHYSFSKLRHANWSSAKVQVGLARAGVDSDKVRLGMALAKEEVQAMQTPSSPAQDDDEDMPSVDPILVKAAARHVQTMKNVTPLAKRRRLTGWLQRRGHSWDTVSSVLDLLSSDLACESHR